MTDIEIENIQQMQQELERLRNENAFLRRELRPPVPSKRTLKYWIVTWINHTGDPSVTLFTNWSDTLDHKSYLEVHNYTHIRILEQIVYV